MSGFKGTPGPWMAREVTGIGYPGQKGFAIDYTEDQEQVVDYVYEEADARLIAAAPELLDSAQLALSIAESWIHDQLDGTRHLECALQSLDPVRAAIAKALGEE